MTTTSPQQRTVFITGASSGIGFATALAFARDGWQVAGTARDAARLQPLQAAIDALPGGALLPLAADVRDAASVQAAVDAAAAQFGRLNVLVANAGVGHRGGVIDADWQDVETLLRTNIDGVLHTLRAGVPVMRTGGGGHVVMLSSVVFNMIAPFAGCYAASKAFTSSIARSLRLELEADNITVTDMIVGRTDTNFNRNRLGGKRPGKGVPSMSADRVADAIVSAAAKRRKTVVVRPFDRLTVLANTVVPGVIGRIALKQYK